MPDADVTWDAVNEPLPAADGLDDWSDALTIELDQQIGDSVWAGSTLWDRTAHMLGNLSSDVMGAIEQSLLAQESYETFEARMLKALGIPEPGRDPSALLADLDTQLWNEAKLAWNRGMVIANDQEDTILVWRAELDDRTTPGCWARHGRPITALHGEMPPRHYNCRCDVITVPNPYAADAEWAAFGQEILDEMAAEREGGQAVMEESDGASWWPWTRSRLAA